MSFSEILTYLMAAFAVLGAIDRCIGYKMGEIGRQFEAAVNTAGPIILAAFGIFVGAPLLGPVLANVLGPFYELFGASPAMAGTIILSIDSGGYQLAHSMTQDPNLANLSAVMQGAMLGPIIAWQLPLAIGLIEKKDQRWLALGSLSGIIAVPAAVFIGGVFAGFDLAMVFHNVLPTVVVCILLAAGLWFFPEKTIKGVQVFGKIMTIVITLFFAIALLQDLAPITIFKGMGTLAEAFDILGAIVPILAGAYPMMWLLTKILKKPLMKVGSLIKLNETSVGGMIVSLANNLPMFSMVKDMDNKGKVLNFAWSSIAAFTLGDHLAFCAAYQPDLLGSMIGCKIVGGILAVTFSTFVFSYVSKRSETKEA